MARSSLMDAAAVARFAHDHHHAAVAFGRSSPASWLPPMTASSILPTLMVRPFTDSKARARSEESRVKSWISADLVVVGQHRGLALLAGDQRLKHAADLVDFLERGLGDAAGLDGDHQSHRRQHRIGAVHLELALRNAVVVQHEIRGREPSTNLPLASVTVTGTSTRCTLARMVGVSLLAGAGLVGLWARRAAQARQARPPAVGAQSWDGSMGRFCCYLRCDNRATLISSYVWTDWRNSAAAMPRPRPVAARNAAPGSTRKASFPRGSASICCWTKAPSRRWTNWCGIARASSACRIR